MNNAASIKRVSVIGAGAWGTSIACVIAEKRPDITLRLWSYEKSVASAVNSRHENTEFLPGIPLPHNIIGTSNLRDAAVGAEVIILATPSKALYDTSSKISKHISRDTHIGYLSKGFCKIHNEVFTISQTLGLTIPHLKDRVTAISGPSHAEEVSTKFHTCLNVAGLDPVSRKIFVELISNDFLQCRESDDIIGVELGGTLKNPAAVAAGMISILPQCGDNLSGALISEALKEMINLARIFRLKDDIMIDISGLGDLVATALSEHSRNRRFGRDIAKQIMKKGTVLKFSDKLIMKIKPSSVVERMSKKLHYLAEGAYAIEPLIELAEAHNVSIPVYRSLYEVLLNKKDPRLLIETIKNPEKFDEFYRKTKIQITDRKTGLEGISGRAFKNAINMKAVDVFWHSDKTGDEGKMAGIIGNLKSYADEMRGKLTSRDQVELRIINAINAGNFNNSIEKLVTRYADAIVDLYTSAVKWLYLFYLRRIKLSKISNFSLRKDVSGDIRTIKNIKQTENVIYISTFSSLEDYIYLILAVDYYRLPFPRFFVNRQALKSNFHKHIVKRSGGYIVDSEKMSNPLYREVLFQYISTMIEHGVPILYFPEVHPDQKDKIAHSDRFFEVIIESLYSYTIEIVLVPIGISGVHEGDGMSSGLRSNPKLQFFKPFYLSEYTKSPYNNTSISQAIRFKWEHDVVSIKPLE